MQLLNILSPVASEIHGIVFNYCLDRSENYVFKHIAQILSLRKYLIILREIRVAPNLPDITEELMNT